MIRVVRPSPRPICGFPRHPKHRAPRPTERRRRYECRTIPTSQAPTTPPRTSRSSRVSTRSASARACTSARPVSAGLHHLIWEVVDNSVDEAMAGYCTRIDDHLAAPTAACRVDDNGRGIPVDPYPTGPHKGKSAAEVVLTVLHAGGKFGGEGYKVSGGLHGVGVSVVNALSERLVVEVDRNGQHHRQEFAKGGKPQGKMEVVGPTPPRAGPRTRHHVTFWPDPTIFVAEGTEFVARTVLERLQTMAFLNRGPGDRLRRRARGSRAGRSRTSTRAASSTSSSTSTPPRRRCSARSPTTRTSTTTARPSTSRSSGTPGTTRASTATPTASRPSRAACTSRASRPRSPPW